MKLRIRAASGGPTLKVDVPALCNLHTLRQTLQEAYGFPFSPPIRLSLNKVEELQGPDSALLSQFGVRSGDLLFYLDPQGSDRVLSAATVGGQSVGTQSSGHVRARVSQGTVETMETDPQVSGGEGNRNMASVRRELCAAAAAKRACLAEHSSTDPAKTLEACDSAASSADTSKDASSPTLGPKINPTDSCDGLPSSSTSGVEAFPVEASNSIPVVLQRVLISEYRNVSRPDELLILAIHAVMLETGFIVWDTSVEGSSLPSGWSGKGTTNLHYTLPELGQEVPASSVGHVSLKCQMVVNNLVIYGTVTMGSPPPIYRLPLQTSKYLGGRVEKPKGSRLLNEKGTVDPVSKDDLLTLFSDLFGLWKGVKDGLSLPLLTALCERAGLPVPPSLMMIPIELKMKILECLPALDLLKVGCTCSELRHLSANDDLWKSLFSQEFGCPAGERAPCFRTWKDAFWQRFLERKKALGRRAQTRRPHYGFSYRFPPYRGFPRTGGIIGGDYDIFPSGTGPFRGGLGGARGPFGGGSLTGLGSQTVFEDGRMRAGGMGSGGMGTIGVHGVPGLGPAGWPHGESFD